MQHLGQPCLHRGRGSLLSTVAGALRGGSLWRAWRTEPYRLWFPKLGADIAFGLDGGRCRIGGKVPGGCPLSPRPSAGALLTVRLTCAPAGREKRWCRNEKALGDVL